MGSEIKYFNRKENCIEVEKVYGNGAVKFLYQSLLGKTLSPIITSKFISVIYGSSQNSISSGKKVPEFIKLYGINLDEYKGGSLKSDKKENSYKHFNEFFIREFEEGQRIFCGNDQLAAFSEARYFGFEKIDNNIQYPVKGKFLSPRDMINNETYNNTFQNGPLLIARLCPVDYHRYHYPDSGRTLEAYPVHGKYHSVNPMALKEKEDIFISNERRVAILDTENFGKLAYIEVGAVCVGKIVQSHDESRSFQRGDQKGYFLFGGSTVIVIGEEGKWTPSDDILKNSAKGLETYIKLGEPIGKSFS